MIPITPLCLRLMGATQSDAEKYADELESLCGEYEINNRIRVCHFLAQVMHESTLLRRTVENMRYSASRLLEVFPRHFTKAQALAYEYQPERIGNHVYADRLGNGPEQTGDGYRYRGRGLIQLTGKDNYIKFGKWAKEDVVTFPQRVGKELAAASAVWFWTMKGMNEIADQNDLREVTRKINGGYNGIAERRKLLFLALEVFR